MNIYIINLAKDSTRREFQKQQMERLQLHYEIVNATTIDDISKIYNDFKDHWQRPMREVEVACYFSHQKLWQRVLKEQKPALILEDDALLGSELPKLLEIFNELQEIDHISLESVGRKKLLGKRAIPLALKPFQLSPLIIDRFGACAYILYPSGAKKLLEHEKQYGIALADAQITSCFMLRSYQLEPACAIQMDRCSQYNLKAPLELHSNISTIQKCAIPQGKYLSFKRKRIAHQLKLALRSIEFLFRTKRRKIEICDSLKALYG